MSTPAQLDGTVISSPWKIDGVLAELRKLVASNKSATEVAIAINDKFSLEFTKNSIISQVNRLRNAGETDLEFAYTRNKVKRPNKSKRVTEQECRAKITMETINEIKVTEKNERVDPKKGYFFGRGPSEKSKEIVDTNVDTDSGIIELEKSSKTRGPGAITRSLTIAIKNANRALDGTTPEQAATLLDQLFGERVPVTIESDIPRRRTSCAWIFEATSELGRSYCCRPNLSGYPYCGFHAAISAQRGWALLGKLVISKPKELTGTAYRKMPTNIVPNIVE